MSATLESPFKLLKYGDVADRLGMTRGGVATLVKAGKLPCVRIGRRAIRFKSDDVDDLIERSYTAGAKSVHEIRFMEQSRDFLTSTT